MCSQRKNMLKCLRAYCDKGQSLLYWHYWLNMRSTWLNICQVLSRTKSRSIKLQKKEQGHLDWTRLVNEGFINDCEFTKIIYMNCRQRHKYESNLHSNEHYLSSSENKAWKKKSALYGIWTHKPMTNWAIKPIGSWSLCWSQINLWSDE